MPKLDIKFKELTPGRVYHADDEGLRINSAGMSIARATSARMGYPETLKISVAEDGTAIQLAVPGPFIVRQEHSRPKGAGKHRVNSKQIIAAAKLGYYKHVGENLFILQ